MIVVDTTVWADWFNDRSSPEVDRLERALEDQDVGLVPVILTEVLQGLQSDRAFEAARAVLGQVPALALDLEGHVAAAHLFRRLRQKGITVSGAVDCIIAQTCIEADVELLTADRDFVAIARHSALRLSIR
jgi:predicted nucleic acid-binding protein